MRIELTDDSTKRNSEQSPLLRLPAELRNKIYQETLSGYSIMPDYLRPDEYYVWDPDELRQKQTHCKSAPGTWGDRVVEDNLWPLVQSLSSSSRQLHAEIGEMLFTESVVNLRAVDAGWEEWLDFLGEKRRAAIEKLQMWAPDTERVQRFTPPCNADPGAEVERIFQALDSLPNLKTLYVGEEVGSIPESRVVEMIAHEAQRRGLEFFFEPNPRHVHSWDTSSESSSSTSTT